MKKKMKMKKYEGGGGVGDDVRARAMKSVEGLEGIKGSDIEDETGTVKGSIKRNEYGDLYDSEMKASVPKKAAEKLTPKAEAPTPKEEPKTAPKSSAFKDSPTAFKDSSSAFKGNSASAAAKEEPKERSLPRGQAKANEGVSSFIKKSMDQIGQEGRDQEARYKATQAKMKESGENLSPRMKAAMASEKAKGMDANNYSMKKGGKVSSASKRADGCAIRGKTRA